ncbi:MAG TPA: TIGR03790 family protein [Verrucomicrobiae bacterium]|nr:TIGR03790 family protein [Verrucomicrobiae bacterium]
MKAFLILLLGVLGLTGGMNAFGAGRGDEVFVVYNSRVPESKGVAEHYATVRQVPSRQVMGLDLPVCESISRADFREHLQKPLAKALESKGLIRYDAAIIPATNGEPRRVERRIVEAKIRYVLLCFGVPLIIAKDRDLHEPEASKLRVELQRNEAAVDNELACLAVLDHMLLAGPRENPLFGSTNAYWFNPTNGIFMVTRLDGPTADIARSLVDKAMEAETNGLWGRGYFDMRGLTNGPFKAGDDWIRTAYEVCRLLGFDTVVDTNGGTFPAAFPLSQVAFYAGWYDEHVSGPFARPTVEFMPGAFAYHLHSFSAATLRSTKHQWAGPLLDRGVTATMGCVDEPYLGGTPNIGIFYARFINNGFSYGEAAYACQNYLSWQTTVVGDPLYRPFGRSPAELAEDLQRRHDKNLEWAYVRLANLKLLQGAPLERIIEALENADMTKGSAVLQEKLADLYHTQGKPESSVHALQEVLNLNPTPQQRVRVMLTLSERLMASGRDEEAYQVYQQFLKDCPDYPDPLFIYRSLLGLAEKLDHKSDAAKYQREITELNEPRIPSAKGPPQRHGT